MASISFYDFYNALINIIIVFMCNVNVIYDIINMRAVGVGTGLYKI